jgi:RNA polymerase sigma-70 factor (ECF subfamily)
MATINLRYFYPWYTHDEFVEVSNDVAAELLADKRYEQAYQRRTFYNKAHYSLDAGDGIEASAIISHNDSPEHIFAMMERHCNLCCSLNSLPEIQGRRVEARYLFGKSIQEIAKTEGVSESSVKESIDRGLKAMEKSFSKTFENCPAKRP